MNEVPGTNSLIRDAEVMGDHRLNGMPCVKENHSRCNAEIERQLHTAKKSISIGESMLVKPQTYIVMTDLSKCGFVGASIQ